MEPVVAVSTVGGGCDCWCNDDELVAVWWYGCVVNGWRCGGAAIKIQLAPTLNEHSSLRSMTSGVAPFERPKVGGLETILAFNIFYSPRLPSSNEAEA